jgi:hypothetical protein
MAAARMANGCSALGFRKQAKAKFLDQKLAPAD